MCSRTVFGSLSGVGAPILANPLRMLLVPPKESSGTIEAIPVVAGGVESANAVDGLEN